MPRFSDDEAMYVRAPEPSYAPLAATVIPANGAVLVAPAMLKNGPSPGETTLINSSATTVFYSPYGTATANDIPLAANATASLIPGAYGISVFNPSGAAVTIHGYQS